MKKIKKKSVMPVFDEQLVMNYLESCEEFVFDPHHVELDEAIALIKLLGSTISKKRIIKLASKFLIPFKYTYNTMIFDRTELIEWCICGEYSIKSVQQYYVYLDIKQHILSKYEGR